MAGKSPAAEVEGVVRGLSPLLGTVPVFECPIARRSPMSRALPRDRTHSRESSTGTSMSVWVKGAWVACGLVQTSIRRRFLSAPFDEFVPASISPAASSGACPFVRGPALSTRSLPFASTQLFPSLLPPLQPRHTSPLRSIASITRVSQCAVATIAFLLRSLSPRLNCSYLARITGLRRIPTQAASTNSPRG